MTGIAQLLSEAEPQWLAQKLALGCLWLLSLAWTVFTTLHAIALRPDPQASRFEKLSRAWPLTGAIPLALATLLLARCLYPRMT